MANTTRTQGNPKKEPRKTPQKQPAMGISNRAPAEEQNRQEKVPPRGQAKK